MSIGKTLVLQEKELLVPRFEPVDIRELLALEAELGILTGSVHTVLRNGDGEISFEAIQPNLITEVGDEYYGERAAGITSPPDQVSGMKLGTDSATAVAKTGSGAGLVTYLSGSQRAIDSGFPTSALSSGKRRIAWKSTWPAAVATSTDIEEAVITNQATLADNTSGASITISRAILATVNKGAADTLEITWNHDLLGA